MKKIFISYRRQGGLDLSSRICDRLRNKGYSVFFDIESMKSGPFNKQIYDKIKECDIFLLILPPNALRRCIRKNDWVRLEIEYAINCNKKIIPVFMNKFKFPLYLPKTLNFLKFEQGITPSMDLFDATIEKLISYIEEPYISTSSSDIDIDLKTLNKKNSLIVRYKSNIKFLIGIAILILIIWFLPNIISEIRTKKIEIEYEQNFTTHENTNINYYLIYDNTSNDVSLLNSYEKCSKILSSNMRENDKIFIHSSTGFTENNITFKFNDNLNNRFEKLSLHNATSDHQELPSDFIKTSSDNNDIDQCIIFTDLYNNQYNNADFFNNFEYITVISNYNQYDITLRNKYDFANSFIRADYFLDSAEAHYYGMHLSNYYDISNSSEITIDFDSAVTSFAIIVDSTCSIQVAFPPYLNIDKEPFSENKHIYRISSDKKIQTFSCLFTGKGRAQILQPYFDGSLGKIINSNLRLVALFGKIFLTIGIIFCSFIMRNFFLKYKKIFTKKIIKYFFNFPLL